GLGQDDARRQGDHRDSCGCLDQGPAGEMRHGFLPGRLAPARAARLPEFAADRASIANEPNSPVCNIPTVPRLPLLRRAKDQPRPRTGFLDCRTKAAFLCGFENTSATA